MDRLMVDCKDRTCTDCLSQSKKNYSVIIKEFAEKLKTELFANCVIIQSIYDTQKEDMDSSEAFQIIDELAEQYGKERIFGRTQIVYEKPAERICKTQVPAEKRKRLHKPRHRGRLLRLKEEEV